MYVLSLNVKIFYRLGDCLLHSLGVAQENALF